MLDWILFLLFRFPSRNSLFKVVSQMNRYFFSLFITSGCSPRVGISQRIGPSLCRPLSPPPWRSYLTFLTKKLLILGATDCRANFSTGLLHVRRHDCYPVALLFFSFIFFLVQSRFIFSIASPLFAPPLFVQFADYLCRPTLFPPKVCQMCFPRDFHA